MFGFIPDGGHPTIIETHIIVPHWGNTEVFSRRTLKVTYLDDRSRSLSNEAIDLDIVRGDDAGWRGSKDARPFGTWLTIPIGAAVVGFGCIGIKSRKDD